MIEEKLAKEKNIHSRNHKEREENISQSGLFSSKVRQMYKQLESNSKIAGYSGENILPTVANQMQRFMQKIEAEIKASEIT